MKRMIVLIAISLLFLAACSGEEEETVKSGESIYEKSCAGCHGNDLKGANGPPVNNMAEKYTEEELNSLIKNGKGMMPGGLLTDEETEMVTKWLLEQ